MSSKCRVLSWYPKFHLFFRNESDEYFPVQNVLFLTNRLYQESSVLVSTERGNIEFWPVFGVTKPSGIDRLMQFSLVSLMHSSQNYCQLATA